MENKYKEISPSRSEIISKHLGEFIYNKNIIEFGASSGSTLYDLKYKYNCEVSAYDVLPVNLSFCESNFFDLDFDDLDSIRNSIDNCDLVLFLDVLEHIKSPKDVLESILRMNDKVKVFMISPNFSSIRMLLSWLSGFVPDHSSGFFDKTHLKWLSPKWLKINLSDAEYESEIFYVFSDVFFFRVIQKFYPSRLCSQFGAVIKVKK
tara:strand:- start:941 stop:1558 length:618 start_codon:yes stop_codon:yes gene_type:complete